MLIQPRFTGSLLLRPSSWRLALFVVVLLLFVKLGKPAHAEPLPPNTVEDFRQFLTNDMDRLGKLVDLKRKTEAKIDMKEEHKEQNDYYQKVIMSLDAQINKAVATDKELAAALEAQLNSAGVTAAVLRLRAWEAPDTRLGLDTLDKGELHARVSARLGATVDDLVAKGSPRDQAALCVLLGEDAAFSRTLKGEGRYYLNTLQKQIPQVVKLSQQGGASARIVRESAAGALARLRAPAKDHIAAVKQLLAEDGGDVASRRIAYKALILPFEAASPRTLSATPNSTQYSATDQLAYANETKQLLDEEAPLALPYLVKGLKDDDLDVRQMSINALRDIAAILLVPLQPAPRLGKDVVDFDFRLKPMIDIIKRVQPLTDQLAENAPALIDAADDANPAIRLQALAMLNDLAESRNRIRGWQAQIDRAATPPPEKPPVEKPVALELQPPARADINEKLTPALKHALKVLAKNLTDPDLQIRLAALEVLESLGPDANAPDAIPALVIALRDSDKFVRWNTVRILNRFGPIDPEHVLPGLIGVLAMQDGDGDFAKILGPTLSAYRIEAGAAVPELIKAINMGEPDARIAYLLTLTYVGEKGAEAIPSITSLLKYRDPHVRQAAAETLGRFGKLAAKAAPDLRAALDDENPDVRKAAGESLLRIDAK